MIDGEVAGAGGLFMAVFESLSQQLHATFGVQIAAEYLLVGSVLVVVGVNVSWVLTMGRKKRRTTTPGQPVDYVDPDPGLDPDTESEDKHDHQRRSRPAKRHDGGSESAPANTSDTENASDPRRRAAIGAGKSYAMSRIEIENERERTTSESTDDRPTDHTDDSN